MQPVAPVAPMAAPAAAGPQGWMPTGGAQLPPGFRKATARQPSWAILARAKPMLLSGNAAQAMELIQQFVALQPLEPEGYFWLGLALDETDQPEQALGAYRQAVKQALTVGMDCAELHTNLGNTLLKLGQADEALQEFQRAIELEPQSWAAYMSMARTFLVKEQPQQALDCLKKCERGSPPQAQLHYYKAKALKALGNVQAAQAEGGEAMRFVHDETARTAIAAEFGLAAAGPPP